MRIKNEYAAHAALTQAARQRAAAPAAPRMNRAPRAARKRPASLLQIVTKLFLITY